MNNDTSQQNGPPKSMLYNNDTEYTLTLQRADGTTVDLALIRSHGIQPVQFCIALFRPGKSMPEDDLSSIALSQEEARLLRDHLMSPEAQTLLHEP